MTTTERQACSLSNRREFAGAAIRSLTALALLEGLAAHRLFGGNVQPMIDAWFAELHAISKDVADHKTKDVEFQKRSNRSTAGSIYRGCSQRSISTGWPPE